MTESAVAAGPQNPNRVDRDIKDDPIQNGDDRGLEDDTVKAPEPKTMHEVHEAREVHDVSRGSANGRAEGETCEPTGQPAAEPGRRFSDRLTIAMVAICRTLQLSKQMALMPEPQPRPELT